MEQLLAARAPYAECLNAIGYTLEELGVTDAHGFPYPDYRVGVPSEGENDALMSECERIHYFYIDMLYQIQPASVQAQETEFVAAMPKLIACLDDGGLPIPEDTTADELKHLMLEDLRAHIGSETDPAASPRAMLVSDCLTEVSISGF